MAPRLLPHDEKRSLRLERMQRSNQFIADNLGKWIADHPNSFAVVCDAELIAINEDPEAAKKMARDQGYDLETCLIVFIPAPGASHYF